MAPKQKRAPKSKADQSVSRQSALAAAARLVRQICCVAGSATLIEDARSHGGLGRAIERFDTPALFDWLMKVISFQGVSDRAASEYMRKHGSVTWLEISYGLSKRPKCPKLRGYWNFHQCGYSKSKGTCTRPDLIARCPLPQHRLRNGRLNQSAYSLYFFIRDIADDDLVNWIDWRLWDASPGSERSRLRRWREALLGPLRNVYGVADKVLSMAFSDLLLAAQNARTHWHELGGSFVAIDTLVHKCLVRTGIIQTLGRRHPYGPSCYQPMGCAPAIERLARKIDAREFNASYPQVFPRFVQHAIWRYCAIDHFNVCNSVKIADHKPCQNIYCRVFRRCAKRPVGK